MAGAQTPSQVYDLPKVVAVQNRAFQVPREFALQLGYLPSDAFNKGYAIGGAYTHFFNDYFGWEVLNASYVINSETNLKKDLLGCCSVDVENVGFGGALDYIEWYALTSVVYTPLYTKSLLFNKKIVHGEISFLGGAGGVKFHETGMRSLVSLGFYVRFFLRPERSWKFEFRDHIYFEKSLGAVNAMALMLSYSFHFGTDKKVRPDQESDEL
ncbi:MAG: outer membrane beta-barrel domain-containing protein [Bdellovibrionales bacterium]